MVLSAAAFVSANVLTRFVEYSLHSFQIIFFQNFFSLLLLMPWIVRFWHPLRVSQSKKTHALRSLLGILGNLLWFKGLRVLPLAEVTAIGLTNVMFVSLGSCLFFKEQFKVGKIFALCLGFSGAFCMLFESLNGDHFNRNVLFPLASTILFAWSSLMIPTVKNKDFPIVTVIFLMFFMIPFSFFGALPFWQPVSLNLVPYLIGIGGFYTLGHFCLTKAFTTAEAGFVTSFNFMRLPFSALLGWVFFQEVPNLWTFWGSCLIFIASLLLIKQGRLFFKNSS